MKKGDGERIASGISGFDELCEGGFKQGSVNLISGEAGTGKTTFMLQFIYTGAGVHGEKGVFISLGQETREIREDAGSFGWDIAKLESSDKVRLVAISPKKSLKSIREEIHELISKPGVKRACIDCLELVNSEKEIEVREFVIDLVSCIKKSGVSVLMSHGESEKNNGLMLLKSLADGIIQFYSSGEDEETDRMFKIVKMRQTSHSRGHNLFEVTDKGIIVYE
ncbi:MAG: hypothetical protein KKE50_02210 [Nanoarchaeota archaeon]|nr:hypothetical protein [Nanoarchaeota archaeon]